MKTISFAQQFLTNCLLLAFVISFTSCETEIDLNAPYKKIPVIYGILDQNDEYHFVKITKTFNGKQDAYEMAAVADSSIVDVKLARVEEVINNQVVKTWTLKDTIVTGKEQGIFPGPSQKLYYFKEPNLNTSSTYNLYVDIGNDEPATASTILVQNSNIFNGGSKFDWRLFTLGVSLIANGTFKGLQVAITPPVNAKSADVVMYFTYCNIYKDGSANQDTLVFPMGNKVVSNPSNPEVLTYSIDDKRFYNDVASKVPDKQDTPNLDYRSAGIFYFEIANVTEDFYTYMEVYAPSNVIFQEKPPYTNINNGIGLFSARTKFNTLNDYPGGATGFVMNKDTEDELVNGIFGGGTSQKGFMRDRPNPCL